MAGMIERVARAICKSQTQDERVWQAFIPESRAAIAAMREPTEEMAFKVGVLTPSEVARVWPQLIDAALEEKP